MSSVLSLGYYRNRTGTGLKVRSNVLTHPAVCKQVTPMTYAYSFKWVRRRKQTDLRPASVFAPFPARARGKPHRLHLFSYQGSESTSRCHRHPAAEWNVGSNVDKQELVVPPNVRTVLESACAKRHVCGIAYA